MPNQSGNAYALTTFCPIKNGGPGKTAAGGIENQSYAGLTRDVLEDFGLNDRSPMAKVPNTYLCRFYVLNDVFYEGKPAELDHLKSKYLVFTSNFHGKLEPYLRGFWQHAGGAAKQIWQHCVGFDKVKDADGFIGYIKKCQVYTTFFFNGSTDESLAEQLKSLYLKQEFTKFVYENQGRSPQELQQAFQEFVARAQPANPDRPTWRPGAASLEDVVVK